MNRPASCTAVATASILMLALLMPSPAAAIPEPPVKIGGEVPVSSFTPDNQYFPDAARRPDGKYIVVWTSDQDADRYGIYLQMFNADRTKYGGEVQVNTHTLRTQFYGRVAAAQDNSFVVTWHSNHQNVYHVQSQRFDSTGAMVGGEFRVSSGETSHHPDVAFLTNGDVVYCWRSQATNGDTTIKMRRLSPTFSSLGSTVVVNADSSQTSQNWPRVAALSGGGFVIVYFGTHTGSDMEEIKGQIYTAAGVAVGSSFQINTYTEQAQRQADVAGLPNGGFIVAWESDGQDGNSFGITARHYAADGTPIGGEFGVNDHTSGAQYRPAVTTFSDNSFAIVWYGNAPTGSGNDIAVQHFTATHDKVGTQVEVNAFTSSTQYMPAVASSWDDGDFGVFYGSYGFQGSGTQYDVAGQWFTADLRSTPAPILYQVAPPCTSACLQYFCTEGTIVDIKVTGVVSNDVYGTTYFSDDSNVAAAAVFAGLVADGETATITAKCSGPKQSFASGSANGVTTQAFPTEWPSSFTFDLGGQTQAPPPPSPDRCFHEPCAIGRCKLQGTSFDLVVEGVVSNNVWGTEEYSDDSFVGAAAVHQGLLEAGSVGSVTVTCAGARTSLSGSTKHGVTSGSFGPWQFTYVVHAGPTAAPAPTADVCVGACLNGKCPETREFFLRVHGSTTGYLWGGNTPYTGDTTVSAAAVHSGLISAGSSGIVKVTCTGANGAFTGSSQNGVTTASFGPWPESFELSVGANMPTVVCGPGAQCLMSECTIAGRVIKVSVTGSTNSATTFWGTTLYTGDSPLSHTAVHAGLLQDGQTGVLYATCQGAHDTFIGSTAHGITSTGYSSPWPGSFTLSASL